MVSKISKILIIGLCKMGLLLMGGISISSGSGSGSRSGPGIGAASGGSGIVIRLLRSLAPTAEGQSAEIQQLLLDVTKLGQFKQILGDLQASYEILYKGYSTVKNIASSNFSLHEAFIDGLLLVQPSLVRYRRVADIISDELSLVAQYKKAFAYFKTCGRFRATELQYMGKVYSNLVDKSVDNLDALTTVLTGGKLRMSDDERLTEINRLYKDTHRMLGFLLNFNHHLSSMANQRGSLSRDVSQLKQMQGLE